MDLLGNTKDEEYQSKYFFDPCPKHEEQKLFPNNEFNEETTGNKGYLYRGRKKSNDEKRDRNEDV